MSYKDHPEEFAKWMEWLFAPQIPQGDIPSNQTKKGSTKLCCGDITPGGSASCQGANKEKEMEMDLSKNARLRLYQLVGYSQGEPLDVASAEKELGEAGLMDAPGFENAKAHDVAEDLLFHAG